MQMTAISFADLISQHGTKSVTDVPDSDLLAKFREMLSLPTPFATATTEKTMESPTSTLTTSQWLAIRNSVRL